MGPDAMILAFWTLSYKPTFFTLLFHFHQETFQFLLTFCHKGGIICISEVIDISPHGRGQEIFAERNSNNLRYADDSTLMAESKEELNNLLMNVKEESEKAGLKLNIQKMKIMVPTTSFHGK